MEPAIIGLTFGDSSVLSPESDSTAFSAEAETPMAAEHDSIINL